MLVDPILVFPDENTPEETDYGVFAVVFEREDWEGIGVKKGALEYNEVYFEKNEFFVFRTKLSDPLYLKEFYDENVELLRAQYWRNISRDRFVVDTVASWPVYFDEFKKAFRNRTVYDIFEPLGKKDVAIRKCNERRKRPHKLLRLKSKFGFIQNRIPFRLYAIEVDFDCFIITGGAIKIVEDMRQASNTRLELRKLNTVLNELKFSGISNKKSLLDCIYERSSQADIDS